MQKHIKVYLEHYWENPICLVCWNNAVDIHHIVYRSKFWTKTKDQQDSLWNLIWLCRNCHELAHKWIYDKDFLKSNLKIWK